VDLADAPAERQPEHGDEQERRENRRQDRLRPQLQHAGRLAAGEREESPVADGKGRDHVAIALT
jgi:hypothetical protein